MTNIFEQLAAPFPKDKIHWRAQSIKKDGTAAMALAYLDARDVMDRLDAVCGPDGWQAEHYDCGGGKMACKIGIKKPTHNPDDGLGHPAGGWVWKSDGAGETNIEAEKGAFSGALKRAGVMWGIGRYLYAMPAPWVPCETYENQQGKKVFKKWKEDPWSYCKGVPGGVYPGDESGADKVTTSDVADLPRNEQEWKEWGVGYKEMIEGCNSVRELYVIENDATAHLTALEKTSPPYYANILDAWQGRREILETPTRDTPNTELGGG